MAKIEGYCSTTSLSPGETIGFHISSEAGAFQYELVRMGVTDVQVASGTGQADNYPTPADADSMGCGWPESFNLTIPPDWTSGIYLLRLASDADTRELSFVVRAAVPGATSRILVMIPVTTSHAYNAWNGYSLYDYNSVNGQRVHQVSFNRPGSVMAGRGGAEWEETFVRWFETGYGAEYCTSIDLHANPGLLSAYQLLVNVGHDEYWSREMRDQAEAFIAAGGNAAFLSGNTCYFQVRFTDDLRTMICFKDAALDPIKDTDPYRVTVSWDDPLVGRSENTLTGVGTEHGAVWDFDQGDLPATNYTVHFSQHWVFGNTGLSNGSLFGASSKLVGYETDAADFTLQNDVPEVTGSDGSPRNFVVLASADLSTWGGQPGKATMGLFRNRGVMFTASTTNWPSGLAADPVVQQITRNVLDRLSRPDAASPPLQNSDFQMLDGWYREHQDDYVDLSGAGAAPTIRTLAPVAANALSIDATAGELSVSQDLELLQGHAFYRVSCWAKASAPGTVISLQNLSSWVDFAAAEHSGNDQWQLLSAIGKVDDGGPLIPARVRIQVAGGKALIARVKLEAL